MCRLAACAPSAVARLALRGCRALRSKGAAIRGQTALAAGAHATQAADVFVARCAVCLSFGTVSPIAEMLLGDVALRLREWRKKASVGSVLRDELMACLTDCVHFLALACSVAASVVVIAPRTKAPKMDSVASLMSAVVQDGQEVVLVAKSSWPLLLALYVLPNGDRCCKSDVSLRYVHKVSANSTAPRVRRGQAAQKCLQRVINVARRPPVPNGANVAPRRAQSRSPRHMGERSL